MQDSWALFLIVVLGLAWLVCFLFFARWYWQRKMDEDTTTWEIKWPKDVTPEQADQLAVAVSGVFNPLRQYHLPHTPKKQLTVEVIASSEGLHYLLTFPTSYAKAISDALRTAVPLVGWEEWVPTAKTKHLFGSQWKHGVNLSRHASNEADPDPKYIRQVLLAMTDLEGDEVVIVQFICVPTGADRTGKGTEWKALWATGRVAAAGSTGRTKFLVDRVQRAYGSLHMFMGTVATPRSLQRISQRQAPFHGAAAINWTTHEWGVSVLIPMFAQHVPGMRWSAGRRLIPSAQAPTDGIHLGHSNYPGQVRRIALPLMEETHRYVGGSSGWGKSTLIENMFLQVVDTGQGGGYIDPHGDSFDDILNRLPASMVDRLVLLDFDDDSRSIGYNPLQGDPQNVANSVMGVFSGVYNDLVGLAQTSRLLFYVLYTLAHHKLTLMEISPLVADSAQGRAMRDQLTVNLPFIDANEFWEGMDDRNLRTHAAPILSRVSGFTKFRSLRGILGQQESALDFGDILNNQKILMIKIPTRLGLEGHFAGSLVMAKLWDSVLAQGKIAREDRPPFNLFIDEFHHMTKTPVSMATMMQDARKFGLRMTLANTSLTSEEISRNLRSAIVNNAPTRIHYRSAPQSDDASMFGREYGLKPEDFELNKFTAIVRPMVNGEILPPLTIEADPKRKYLGHGEALKDAVYKRLNGKTNQEVEDLIAARRQAYKKQSEGRAPRTNRRPAPEGTDG